VKSGGFTKASQTIGIAQSALSISVKILEDETGITLLDRNHRKLKLTAEGEIFLKRAESIIGQVNALHHEMEELKGLVQVTLKVGIPGMLATHHFPAKLSKFRELYPNLKISIFSDGAKKLEEMLCAGLLDAAILGGNKLSSALSWKPLLKDEMVACVSNSHHLAKRKQITIQELAEEPLFLFQEGNYQRELISNAFKEKDLSPQILFETNLTSLLKTMTAEGGGVCTLLKMAIDTPKLIPIPLQPAIEINAVIAWQAKSYVGLATNAFIEFLLDESRP